jgi:hypothetical protein
MDTPLLSHHPTQILRKFYETTTPFSCADTVIRLHSPHCLQAQKDLDHSVGHPWLPLDHATALPHLRQGACEDSDVLLKGHKRPRQYVRPMISPLGFRMVRSDVRIHALGRVHIGGSSHVCMVACAQCRGNGPKARTGSSPHDLFHYNVKAAFVEVICGFNHASSLTSPAGEAQAPQHLRQEACTDSPVMWSTTQ